MKMSKALGLFFGKGETKQGLGYKPTIQKKRFFFLLPWINPTKSTFPRQLYFRLRKKRKEKKSSCCSLLVQSNDEEQTNRKSSNWFSRFTLIESLTFNYRLVVCSTTTHRMSFLLHFCVILLRISLFYWLIYSHCTAVHNQFISQRLFFYFKCSL